MPDNPTHTTQKLALHSPVSEKTIVGGVFVLKLVKSLQHINQYQSEIVVQSAITCVLPMPTAVYTGDEGGRVVSSDDFSETGEWCANFWVV